MKKEKDRFYLASIEYSELLLGIALIVISFFMPVLFNVHNFLILKYIVRSLVENEKIDLVAAAIQLVALNAVRGIPHYVGAFFVGESLAFRWKGHRAWQLNSLMILLILILTYQGIGEIHDVHYDFGIPAVLVCFFVLVFRKVHYRYISFGKKAIMIILVLVAFQFLDIMPAMSMLPVGRGETSMEIKTASVILDAEAVLNTVGLVGVLLFLLFALVVFFQLREENNLKELNCLREQNQEIKMQAQLNEIKNRTHQEMQYLVHDLKSPLTTVQTLSGVLKMECEKEKREQDIKYLNCMENALERINEMISEILYQEQCIPYTTQELVGVVLAQSSVHDYAAYLHVENLIPDVTVNSNRFLFPRVLINLIENSAQAMDEQPNPEIWLRVKKKENLQVIFSVEDNGSGIDEEQLKDIWSKGVSGNGSSGLGLAFVHSVVERMKGEICIQSSLGSGTQISLILPEKSEERY